VLIALRLEGSGPAAHGAACAYLFAAVTDVEPGR